MLLDIDWKVKLCDFGLSRLRQSETMTKVGTVQWAAPEILSDDRYTEKVDLWRWVIHLT